MTKAALLEHRPISGSCAIIFLTLETKDKLDGGSWELVEELTGKLVLACRLLSRRNSRGVVRHCG